MFPETVAREWDVSEREPDAIWQARLGGRLSRRDFIARGARLTAGVTGASTLLAACTGTSTPSPTPDSNASPQISGTAVLASYPGWMGKREVASFEQQYPNASVKQVSAASGSTSSEVLFFRQNTGQYDFSLEDQSGVGQLLAAGLIQPPDWSKIPNIKNADETFRKAYAHGIPTDYGKVGIGYRTDLVAETITSW